MTELVKKIKLHVLQSYYKELSQIIFNLSNHYDFLFDNFLIEFSFKQIIMNKLNDLNKNINTSYNNFIVEDLELNNELDKWILDFSKNIKITDETQFNEILNFCKFIKPENQPLFKIRIELVQLLSSLGYKNLDGLLYFFIGRNYKSLLDKQVVKYLVELNNIFIPTSFDIFEVDKSEPIYWRKPKNFEEMDLLHQTRELWIKYYDKYIKISGIFKNDNIGIIFKTAQISYPNLYLIKNNIDNELEKSSIDKKFYKKFTRYDYIGNLYVYDTSEYLEHVEKYYQRFLELTSSTFLSIMKEFISESSNLKNMFEIIFILLLGTEDNIDIAGLLLGLTKEKKTQSINLFNLINNHLGFNLQVKLKKSSNHLKQEIDRLKTLTLEDIDYKKQLISNKHISDNVKALTLEKIQEMKLYNNEYYKQSTFVKHILNFPWTSDNDDIFFKNMMGNSKKTIEYLTSVQNKLKNSSYGHEEAKKSLLQVIGKWLSNPSSQGTSFGLVGPPGVGKTLLAKSVSKALGIPFVQITLGGQNDGELLHGHGYTYSGSQPGLIIKKMVEAGKARCILYFDELDKATSKHGHINEITSILIHLTDPNMNKSFQDRFFQGVDFPLDKVVMIFSYNDSSLVDPILLDRLKEITVKPYTTNEKIKIVKEFIIKEIVDSIGLENEEWTNLSDEIIEYIIENYTNEAGVRDIKRYIEKIFLTLNLDRLYKRGLFESNIKSPTCDSPTGFTKNKVSTLEKLEIDMINTILEKPNNEIVKIHPNPEVGIINGMYATSNGDGGIIPIQIFANYSSAANSYEIKLTGKQGEVMKESVHCSLTAAIDYIRKNIKKYKIKDLDKHLLENFKFGFHVHAPSTSTPKDGPSAGCAFTSAFISRILGKQIRNDIAMTGEIELTGRITKIGGLNFKLIGAKKAGVKLVFVPKENEKDLEEIKEKYPKLFDENFDTKYYEFVDEIIDTILI
jgi:endopeptidase La